MCRKTLGKLLQILALGAAALGSRVEAQDIQVITYTNTTWIYNDSSTAANNPGTLWKEPGFVPVIGTGENQWKANGRGLFGNDTSAVYNEPNDPFRGGILGFATPLDRNINGTAARVTFYFITKFDWPYDPAGVILRGTNYLDDGAIVYLNGVEVFRARVPGTPGTAPDWSQLADNQGAEGVPEPLEYSATSLLRGENVLAVELHQSGAASSDVAFATALRAVIPFAPVITSANEPADRAVVQNRSTTLTVTGDGSPRPTFQWYVDDIPIPGATEPSYTIPSMTETDAGVYKVILSNEFGSASSRGANVTYVPDTQPPVVVSVAADNSFKTVIIELDEVITKDTAEDLFGYEITDGPNLPGILTARLLADGKTVMLGLDASLEADTTYTIAVKSPTDLVNLTIATGTTATFRTWKIVPGFITFETYNTPEAGVEITKLTSAPSFPFDPRETFYITAFDTRKAYPDDSHEQFGGRLSGVFIPPTSGNWIFYLSSDDSSELYLNPVGKDAGGKALMTAETGCCNGFAAHPSAPQTLTEGEAYYIEAIYKEGGGGDYCRVAAKLESDPTDPNSLSPIPAAWLGTAVYPVGLGINITRNPANQIVPKSKPPQTVGLEDFNTSGAGFTVLTPNSFQGTPWTHSVGTGSWQVNQSDTENGAANTTYLISPTLSVVQSGVLTVTFNHRWSLEVDNWDGCAIQVSINGGAFTKVPGSAFSAGGYNGTVVAGNSILTGQEAWVLTSAGHQTPGYVTSVVSLGDLNAGDTVQLRFLYAGDTNTKGPFTPSWEINSVEFSPALESNYADSAVTFTTVAEATLNSAPTPVAYQWQRNTGAGFLDIAGATATTYSLVPSARDSGTVFRCIVRSPGAEATSTEARLDVVPRHTITLTGASAVISWPAPSTDFVLQQASALLTPATTVWTSVGIAPTVSGGYNTVTIPGVGVGQKFYRLAK